MDKNNTDTHVVPIRSEAVCKNKDIHCKDCILNPICLPAAVSETQLTELDSIIKRSRPLKRGEHLFRASDAFHAVYAVRSGGIKTYSISEDGDEQVTGFYLPGELFGMDGIGTDSHTNSAKTLESTSVCKIPFNQLEELSAKIPSLQKHFFQLLSAEIQADQKLLMLLGKKPAEERVAFFLYSLSSRYLKRGLSPNRFRLPMSRNDIGSYLGLAVETVSRVFTRFQNSDMLFADGKEVEILDRHMLCQAANVRETAESMKKSAC